MTEQILKWANIIKVIERTDALITQHFKSIEDLLNNSGLRAICKEYGKYRDEYKNSEFNVFTLISDLYYRENLHSDIIKTFLDPKGGHQEGDKFLKILINLVGNNKELNLANDFGRASVTREESRIDILIKDEVTGKAIIIENKINNATDTHRQLPNYVSKIGKANIVAIIYLPLDPYKCPDEREWRDDEIDFINSKLLCLPAYNRTENDFFNAWLQPCIREAKNDDSREILKQYSKLIRKLGSFMMNKQLFENFYSKIRDKVFFESALSVKELMDNLPEYRAERIRDHFNKDPSPFKEITVNKGTEVYFTNYKNGAHTFEISLTVATDSYELRFYDFEEENIIFTRQIIDKIKDVKFNDPVDYYYVKKFDFPADEEELYDFIIKFIAALKDT